MTVDFYYSFADETYTVSEEKICDALATIIYKRYNDTKKDTGYLQPSFVIEDISDLIYKYGDLGRLSDDYYYELKDFFSDSAYETLITNKADE